MDTILQVKGLCKNTKTLRWTMFPLHCPEAVLWVLLGKTVPENPLR